jgi:hypothetical protein
MIERYTIEFGPAVSQKELEKALHEFGETPAQIPDLTRVNPTSALLKTDY